MAILKLKQEDGSWVEVPALIGKNGKTPYIKDGYWYIDGVNTGVKAKGTDGKDGANGLDGKDGENGKDGKDGEDGKDGKDGKTPYIKDGYWYIGNTNTNIKAEGVDGTDGKTAYKYAQDGGYGGTEEQFAEKLANGFGGLHIGSSTPPDTADVWVDPNGDPTTVEEWEFDMDDGTVETKSVVVTESEDATNGKKAAILRVRQADGSFAEIPALVGRKGEDGKDGADGKDGTNGKDGANGTNGKSAYEYAKEGGFTGTEAEFMAKLATAYLALSGGAMMGAIDVSGTTTPLQFGTTGYFSGKTSSGNSFDFFGLINSTRFRVGGSYPALELVGKNARPTYNGSNMALQSDVPTTTENWTFTLESGSTVTKVVYVG